MGRLVQIDRNMPLTFSAFVNETITDSEMVDLAKRMNNPRLLLCDVPLAGVPPLEINDHATVGQILAWLQSNEKWRSCIEHTLQGMSEIDGKPLLTAFMPISVLVLLGQELLAEPQFAGLDLPFAQWQAMGAETGYFDGFRL
jgi:hypothetical protein